MNPADSQIWDTFISVDMFSNFSFPLPEHSYQVLVPTYSPLQAPICDTPAQSLSQWISPRLKMIDQESAESIHHTSRRLLSGC